MRERSRFGEVWGGGGAAAAAGEGLAAFEEELLGEELVVGAG